MPRGVPASFRACTTPGAAFRNGTHAWALTTLAPVLPGGWALLGEAAKFVSVSGARFRNVDGADARELRLEMRGMPFERLGLLVVSPPPHARVWKVDVQLASSRNGRHWMRGLRTPIFPNEGPAAGVNNPSSVIRQANGSWLLYASASTHEHGDKLGRTPMAIYAPEHSSILTYAVRKDGCVAIDALTRRY